MNDYPLGTTLAYSPDEEVDIAFTPAGISKAEARQLGLTFCEAGDEERAALLDAVGPVMIRRSLLVLGNLAARMGEPDAAAYARNLRSSITVLRGYTVEDAS